MAFISTEDLTEEARRCRESAAAADGRGDSTWAGNLRAQAGRIDRAIAERSAEEEDDG